ncbi:RloB family protein [Streptomyces sp. SS8]
MSGRGKREQERQRGGGRGRRRERPVGGPARRPVTSYGDRSQRVVYIACEGTKTEHDYLRLLNTTYGDRPGKQPFHLHYIGDTNGLRPEETVDRVLEEAGPEDEKWVLFDRDAKDNRDADIPRAMRKAHENGVQVGLSHPSFELWLLLHFKSWTSQENGRDDKVKGELRRHRDAKGFQDYDKASGDRGKGLGGQRGQSLIGRERTAIRNARGLIGQCPHGACSARRADAGPIRPGVSETYGKWVARTGHAADCDPLRRDPSTEVWRLLTALDIGTEGP